MAVNATAATAGHNATGTPLPAVDIGSSVLVTLGYLCLLLGVIFLAYWLLRRLGVQGMGVRSGNGAPRLLTRLMLGNRQSVAVVRYRDKDMVLGVTEERVTLLREFEADDAAEEAPADTGFARLLKRKTDEEGQG
ncbi:flagellar biosynthetic protein FliO [Pseudodesulfovibrio cashew]|uniref:Flagellar protein n=1 Tax=Pseudodesulfovibrio cashew TaxID=2678688 RepID=A0A6I6JDU4_9BACT|nr:flagellar biosynthetic protein FliO [Pseudodesulfovibrio cashew]QGY39250.1 flagellar biosynthetic protein FliO [Pseudodesulfovibrio cashew]